MYHPNIEVISLTAELCSWSKKRVAISFVTLSSDLNNYIQSQQLKFGFRRNPNFQKIQVGIEKRNFRLQLPQSATILHIIDNFKWAWAVCSIRQTASGILLYNTGVDEKNSSKLRLISQNCAKIQKLWSHHSILGICKIWNQFFHKIDSQKEKSKQQVKN